MSEGNCIHNLSDIAFEKDGLGHYGKYTQTQSDGGGAVRHCHVLCGQNSPHASRYGKLGAALSDVGTPAKYVKIHRQSRRTKF